MNIYGKLLEIQNELKAPKSQYNSFGKYNYRNCEDILEAVKPLCKKQNVVLFLKDKINFVEGRFYVEATATLVNVEKPEETIEVTANAREEAEKKGMDGSQVTGASSSYARKYALNGLFDIDDTKDADTNEYKNTTSQGDKKTSQKTTQKPVQNKQQEVVNKIQQEKQKITPETIKQIEALAQQFADEKDRNIEDVYKALQEKFKYKDIKEITNADGKVLCNQITSWIRTATRTRRK